MTLAQQQKAVEPRAQAVCPEHPQLAAVATCERCGRYVCEDCKSPGGHCTACQLVAFQGLPSSAGRAKVAIFFFMAGVALEACSTFLAVLQMVAPEPSTARTLLEAFLSLGELGVRIGTIIAFLMWLHLSARQTVALGLDIGETPGWAVGWWFVPFANLNRPYRVVRQMVVALGGEGLAEGLSMQLWWGMWLGGNIVGNIQGRMAVEREGLAAPSAYYVTGILSALLSITAALLCVRIVREIQAQLDLRRHGRG